MAVDTALVASVAIAFALPLAFLLFIRRIEKYGREPVRWLALAFVIGALIPVPFALFGLPGVPADGQERIFRLVILTPIIEEPLKGLAVALFRRRITEPLDGFVYGAAIGLGFAALETTMYALARAEDPTAAILTAIGRAFTTAIMHAVATAIVGYGLTVAWSRRPGFLALIGLLLVAILLHAAYNLGAVYFSGPTQALIFNATIVVIGAATFPFTYRWVREKDRHEVDTI